MSWLCSRVFLPGLALLACLVLVGCGREVKRATVTGKVTLKDQPPNLKGLRISFSGSDNKWVMAEVDPSGEYRANVLCGENLVVVSWQPPDEEARPLKPKDGGNVPALADVLPKAPIPTRYASPATSNLKCDIEADKANTYNVDLVD